MKCIGLHGHQIHLLCLPLPFIKNECLRLVPNSPVQIGTLNVTFYPHIIKSCHFLSSAQHSHVHFQKHIETSLQRILCTLKHKNVFKKLYHISDHTTNLGFFFFFAKLRTSEKLIEVQIHDSTQISCDFKLLTLGGAIMMYRKHYHSTKIGCLSFPDDCHEHTLTKSAQRSRTLAFTRKLPWYRINKSLRIHRESESLDSQILKILSYIAHSTKINTYKTSFCQFHTSNDRTGIVSKSLHYSIVSPLILRNHGYPLGLPPNSHSLWYFVTTQSTTSFIKIIIAVDCAANKYIKYFKSYLYSERGDFCWISIIIQSQLYTIIL
ncbi:hypothetical protein VP01_990g2 [Puccinia sorghi]|uniref:Uncharacterized protein n=1 Tax=Puccinia sorghi TaxID=27349 RepID=A0A0L6U5E8_9BASI|nr:hypothetical protein VP01_990g2 [Puccinia sorghi]